MGEIKEIEIPITLLTPSGTEITIVHEDGLAMETSKNSNEQSYGVYCENEWKAKFTRTKNENKFVFSGTQIGRDGKKYPVESEFAKKWWAIHRRTYEEQFAKFPRDNFKELKTSLKNFITNLRTRFSK